MRRFFSLLLAVLLLSGCAGDGKAYGTVTLTAGERSVSPYANIYQEETGDGTFTELPFLALEEVDLSLLPALTVFPNEEITVETEERKIAFPQKYSLYDAEKNQIYAFYDEILIPEEEGRYYLSFIILWGDETGNAAGQYFLILEVKSSSFS